jgi:hypothetical protein
MLSWHNFFFVSLRLDTTGRSYPLSVMVFFRRDYIARTKNMFESPNQVK